MISAPGTALADGHAVPQISGMANGPGTEAPAMKELSMKRTITTVALALVAAAALSGAARAQTAVSDTDGNGVFSIEELRAAYPQVNGALFGSVDIDGNGSVDADELQAARENGTLPN